MMTKKERLKDIFLPQGLKVLIEGNQGEIWKKK